MLNGSLVMHFLWEAIPHLILQSYNNTAIHEPWTAFKLFSVASSAYQVLGGLYTYVYLRHGSLWDIDTVELEDIPQTLSCLVCDLVRLPPAKKTRPLPFVPERVHQPLEMGIILVERHPL